jgi:hypothetical protein
VSDIHDYQYPHDDADVIEIKQAMDSTSIALVPDDLTRVKPSGPFDPDGFAADIMRVDDAADRDRGVDGAAGPFGPPAPSSASKALAAVLVFDLDRETL